MTQRRRLLLLFVAIILGCNSQVTDQANRMDEATFWAIIDSVKGSGDEATHSHRLASKLEALSNDQLVQFYVCYQATMDRANLGDLWAAGVLVNGGNGSDDGFEYFRNWLIGQGSSVYRLAISTPDTLATVDVKFQDGQPIAEWESFGHIASDVFSNRTGGSIDQVAEPLLNKSKLTETQPFDWSAYSDEIFAVRLPKLWAKYGETKVGHDQRIRARVKESELRMQTQAFEIPGLGKVTAGVVLYHKKYGAGTVIGIDKAGQDFMARISFSGTVRPMLLTTQSELFSRQPFK
jgi:hypothetical protein